MDLVLVVVLRAVVVEDLGTHGLGHAPARPGQQQRNGHAQTLRDRRDRVVETRCAVAGHRRQWPGCPPVTVTGDEIVPRWVNLRRPGHVSHAEVSSPESRPPERAATDRGHDTHDTDSLCRHCQ